LRAATDPSLKRQQLPLSLRLSAHGAAFSLILEQWLRPLTVPLMALAAYAALGMMGALALLPGVVRVAVLAALCLWFILASLRAARATRAPDLRARLRRLEQASQLPAGSLLLHVDTPADQNLAQAYWQRAIARLPKLAALPWPRRAQLWQDRFGLAPLLILLLIAAPFVGGNKSLEQLQASLSPWPTSLDSVQISAVIRPPRYTDLPPQPLLLRGGGRANVSAVTGSDMLITVSGQNGTLKLGDVVLRKNGASSAGVLPLRKAGRYKLTSGLRTIATMDVTLRADGAPVMAFVGAPKITASQSLDVRYTYGDDYGLKAAVLVATDGRFADAQMLPKPGGVQGTAQVYRDLTPSRFAGQNVQLFLVGIDAQGNKAASAPLRFTLPERSFTHPVAQKIVGVRKGLFVPEPNFASISSALDLMSRQLDSYKGDLTVFAALRMIRHRLARPNAATQVESSAGMLWQAALDLDGAGATLQALRAAMENLQQAMRDGKNVDAAMAALQQQLAAFMAKQAQELQNNPDAAAQAVQPEDIAQMLAEMQAQLAAGDRASAAEMLKQLQQMMENMQSSRGGTPQQQAARAALQALRGLSMRQQGLMNETAAANITSAIVGADQLQQDTQKLAQAQKQLQEQLQGLPLRGNKALDGAGAAMGEAAGQLRDGASRQALRNQGKAMNNLRDAMAQLQQQAGGQGARGLRSTMIDPLGRYNGAAQGPEYKLPGAAERQQLQEIRRLLQARAADPARSAAERAYILRLLQQF
jgi:hypothetical protein